MTKDCQLAGEKLFEHLNGALEADASASATEHLSGCEECSDVAALVVELRRWSRRAQEAGGAQGTSPAGAKEHRDKPRSTGPSHGQYRRPGAEASQRNQIPQIRISDSAPLELQNIHKSTKPEIPPLSGELSSLDCDFTDLHSDHPSTGELASFFYAHTDECGGPISGHVALCGECASFLSRFAQGEVVASNRVQAGRPADALGEEPPAGLWKLIDEWENSELSRPRPSGEVLDCEMVEMLLKLVGDRRKEIYEMAQRDIIRSAGKSDTAQTIPVVVVNREGDFQGVKLFREVGCENGAQVLKYFGGSDHFEDKVLHALLDYGKSDVVVSSDRIRNGSARIEFGCDPEELKRADYFIFQD